MSKTKIGITQDVYHSPGSRYLHYINFGVRRIVVAGMDESCNTGARQTYVKAIKALGHVSTSFEMEFSQIIDEQNTRS